MAAEIEEEEHVRRLTRAHRLLNLHHSRHNVTSQRALARGAGDGVALVAAHNVRAEGDAEAVPEDGGVGDVVHAA